MLHAFAKHNCNTQLQTTLEKQHLKITIEKQQLLKQFVETLRGPPSGAANCDFAEKVADPAPEHQQQIIKNMHLMLGWPRRLSNDTASKAMKNPYRLRLPLGNEREKVGGSYWSAGEGETKTPPERPRASWDFL